MSKIRKILYIILIILITLGVNSTKVLAADNDFPKNMYEFSTKENRILMSNDFLQKAIKKIGTSFPIANYVQGFKNAKASSHAWCLNEYSGNIVVKGKTNERMLLAIIDMAPKKGEDATKAFGYSYIGSGKNEQTLQGSDYRIAAISYLSYLASYYYEGANDKYFEKATSFEKNYIGKMWVQNAWWHGYKKGFASALKPLMSWKAYSAFESYNTRSYKNVNQNDLVAFNAAMEYADFCQRLVGNKGRSISSDQTTIEKTKKTDNAIVVGPIKLTNIVIDNINKGRTPSEGGIAEGYVWSNGKGTTINIGEGTKNKITVKLILKNGKTKSFTYNVLNKETSGEVSDIKIASDLDGNNEKALDQIKKSTDFYLSIKDKNIKYGEIDKIEIIDSYQLYSGRMYMFDSCGSVGEDQAVTCGIVAGNEKDSKNKVEFKLNSVFDLSLRKAVTSKNGEAISEDRGLKLTNISRLKNNESTTAEYSNKKDPIEVQTGDKLTYTIRVYNEGIIDGYATEITEYVPEGLKVIENSQINKKYKWTDTKKTTIINGITYKIYTTNYLKDKKINAYNEGNNLSSEDIQIELEVDKIGGKLDNIASITGAKDIGGNTDDRDSKTNVISGTYNFNEENSTYQEDDDDYDSVLKLIDIGGIVFLDGHTTKAVSNEINGIYEPEAGEKTLPGIKVELYNGSNKKLKETVTDANGHYKFEKLSSRDSYYVKFYYNGVEYKVAEYTHGKADEPRDNDSIENEAERNALNAKFSEISREFIETSGYKETTISAKTVAHKGTESTDIFNNLNLGIYVRTRADLSLTNDVLNTEVQVNGKKQVYEFNSIQTAETGINEADLLNSIKEDKEKSENYEQNIYQSDVVKGKDSFRFLITYRIRVRNESNVATSLKEVVDYYDEKYVFNNVLVQTSKGEKINAEKLDVTKYKSIINDDKINNINKDSGYKALYINLKDEKELEIGEEVWIDITYELKDAANVIAKELENADKTKTRNYAEIKGFKTKEGVLEFDSTPGNYDIKNYEATKEDDNGKTPAFIYKKVPERTLSGNVWEAISNEIKQSADLYNNDKILTYVKDNGIKGIKVELVELCQDKTQKIADLIDENKNVTKAETITNENGEYEFKGYIPGDYVVRFTYGTDKGVQGKTTYDYNGKTYNAIINGQNYQSTKVNPNINNTTYWYDDNKDTKYSDAYDEAAMRAEQLKSFTEFGYDEASKLLEQDREDYQNTKMMAYTGKLNLEIEYATTNSKYNRIPAYNIVNIDFGLTPRTEADIQINKTIKHIKFTLNNGTVHIDAGIEDIEKGKVKDAQYLRNSGVNLQLEDEIIQGATLEIEYNINVKNATKKEIIKIFKAEDESTAAVTYYGENIDKHPAYEGKDEEKDKILVLKETTSYDILNKKSEETIEPEIKVLKLLDYSQSLIANVEDQKDIWKNAENAKLRYREQAEKEKDTEKDLDLSNCIELINGFTLKSGEDKNIGIKSSTILSPSGETDIDFNYINNALITKLSTNTARIKDLTDLQVKSEETIITNPTGQQVIYYIITGAAIVIFALGTVLIKKYALKKKEE